jgi:hypothetical protein
MSSSKTKRELEALNKELKLMLADLKESHEHELRRLHRAIAQMGLDLKALEVERRPERKVYASPQSRQALERAQAEWELNVTEPSYGGDWQRINTYIKSSDGIGWSWEADYTANGQFSWCGAFVAFAYGRSVLFNIRQKIFPSCYRMWSSWGKTSRCRDGETPQPGDIVTVYTSEDRSPVQGNHIVLVASTPDDLGLFDTIEGNAHGEGPEGRIEGVIKRQRSMDSVAHIYRLLSEDFED